MFRNSGVKGERGVRLRFRDNNADNLPEHYGSRKQQRKHHLPISPYHLIIVMFFLTFVGALVEILGRSLPTPLMEEDIPSNPQRFISEKAMKSLEKLTKLGDRPVGSYENEVLAVKIILGEINAIAEKSKPVHVVNVEVQKTSGAFPLHFLDGMTNVYRNVQNIIVKVSSQVGSRHSFLINCHFDTVSDSPGGSDDGASCAIMLEILRVITQTNTPLKHNLVLLFNGAEENFMQASHGFITQHPWAKHVRAFINMEACGAGGREIVFQAGPNHPWLMQAYSESVPHPYASSLAQEIFQSGLFPGDTDFRIFRDFGNVSGLDLAWSSNGYVYHTKFDDVNQIPLGTLQRTGDNVLALTQAITSDYHLADTQLYKEGNLIFFDFLGLFVIRWSELFGLVINTSAVALSVFSVVKNMKHGMITNAAYYGYKKRDVSRRDYMRQLVRSVGVALASWLLALLFAVLLALALTVLGCTMSWFSRPLWIVFLYIIPSLLVPMVLLSLVSRWQRPVIGSPWTLFQLYYDSYQLIWTFLLVLSIVFKIRSGLVPLMWVLFPALGNLMRDAFFRHCKDSRWLVFHISVLILPLTQCMYLILAALTLFVPVMGRSGAGNNAEVIVAILSSAQFVLLFSYLIPLILLVRSPQKVLGFLGSLFLLAVLLLVLTPLGFPYSGEMPSPRPQRFLITHTERTYHDIAGKVRSKETGYWVADLDLNSPDSVKSLVPEFARVRLVDDCEDELYCGLPYLMPVVSFLWKTHWIPAHPPDVPIPTTLTLMSTETRPPSVRRLTFNVTGPDHIGVMLSPVSGVTLDRWSLVEGEPLKSSKWNTRDTYFVYYSYASDPEPLVFWIDLNVPDIDMKQILDIAVTSHFLHGPHKTSPEFVRFMGQFPSWASPSGWVATYSSFKF